VIVIAGKDAAGDKRKNEPAKVIEVRPSVQKAVVAGRNIAKKHKKPRGPRQPGGIIEVPMPIHVSNLMLVCPKCGKPTRVARRRLAVEGQAKSTRVVRVCKRCSAQIDEE
jgi:large subunit ribosomal protein L24